MTTGTAGPLHVGMVGLGNMGSALAANLVGSGLDVVTHDVAGPERSPDGAAFAPELADVARRADVVVLSLPDGSASAQVCRDLVAVSPRRTTHVVDTSTIGVEAARSVEALLSAGGVGYVDAPVSGGVAGARARTLSVMVAGPEAACAAVEPVLAGLSDRRRWVGERPGLAQALKLANNFLSATALAAASEAVAFGLSVGLDMATMLDVLNASSGQSAATSDKFVHHILTGRYASGFANTLMAKDLALYLGAVGAEGTPSVLGQVTASVWERFAAAEPEVDFTRIYPFVESS
ncbi:MAG TPA: NAD(P)-dependent oxidoreductase [Acidimicrobiales bacterium]|nr:NAD(P)-dependent oxidoreductase [Acidimicrobiales bacterium]